MSQSEIDLQRIVAAARRQAAEERARVVHAGWRKTCERVNPFWLAAGMGLAFWAVVTWVYVA